MSKNRKESCNLHLYLGKKDLEILMWKASLPPRCFKYYMEQILLSYITGQKVMIPTIKEVKTDPAICPIHLVITNRTIIEFLEQFDKGEKSKSIKDILTYYIREAKDGQYISRGKKAKRTQVPIYNTPILVSDNEKQPTKETNRNKKDNRKNYSDGAKQPPKQNTPQITVEPKKEITPKPETKKQSTVDTKSPMMQALFKMSGDE